MTNQTNQPAQNTENKSFAAKFDGMKQKIQVEGERRVTMADLMEMENDVILGKRMDEIREKFEEMKEHIESFLKSKGFDYNGLSADQLIMSYVIMQDGKSRYRFMDKDGRVTPELSGANLKEALELVFNKASDFDSVIGVSGVKLSATEIVNLMNTFNDPGSGVAEQAAAMRTMVRTIRMSLGLNNDYSYVSRKTSETRMSSFIARLKKEGWVIYSASPVFVTALLGHDMIPPTAILNIDINGSNLDCYCIGDKTACQDVERLTFQYFPEIKSNFHEVVASGSNLRTTDKLLDKPKEVFDSFYPDVIEEFGGVAELSKAFMDGKSPMMILAGPPGTGKTTYIRHLVNEVLDEEGHVFVVTPEVIMSHLQDLLMMINRTVTGDNKTALVVCEDAETILSAKRESGSMVSELLQILDGFGSATFNIEELVDLVLKKDEEGNALAGEEVTLEEVDALAKRKELNVESDIKDEMEEKKSIKFRLILTTNKVDPNQTDGALLRVGRCAIVGYVRELDKQEALLVLKDLGRDVHTLPHEYYSLSELTNVSNETLIDGGDPVRYFGIKPVKNKNGEKTFTPSKANYSARFAELVKKEKEREAANKAEKSDDSKEDKNSEGKFNSKFD